MYSVEMSRIVTHKSNFSLQSRKFAPLCWKSSELQTDLYLVSPSLSNIKLHILNFNSIAHFLCSDIWVFLLFNGRHWAHIWVICQMCTKTPFLALFSPFLTLFVTFALSNCWFCYPIESCTCNNGHNRNNMPRNNYALL